MTREEAQKILAEYVKACREDDMLTLEQFVYEEVIEAMSMGAEALSVCPVYSNLEEVANKFAVFYDQGTCDGIAQDCFIAGAKWQAEQLLKSSPLPEDTVLFNKGVEEGKRLMMEEAYDGEFFYNPYPGIALDDCKDYDFKQREDVRVIILPKED